jgi:hypothetical protein
MTFGAQGEAAIATSKETWRDLEVRRTAREITTEAFDTLNLKEAKAGTMNRWHYNDWEAAFAAAHESETGTKRTCQSHSAMSAFGVDAGISKMLPL